MRDDVVLLDGAVGTSLWGKADEKVAVWRYNVENIGGCCGSNPAYIKRLADKLAELKAAK